MSALSKKIFLTLSIGFVFFFLFSKSVLANCDNLNCGGDKGECNEGVVKNCVIGVNPPYEARKCTNGNWVPTTETPSPGITGCTITIMGQTVTKWFEPQSFGGFQEDLYNLPAENQIDDKKYAVIFFSNYINSINLNVYGKTIATNPGIIYNNQSGGAIAFVSNLITSLYTNPPASGIEYLADLGRNFGIISPVYAQSGIGFKGLAPILPLWKAFRNCAYFFYIIIFIVTGLAIMFRQKISPQAVITIENALPNIIISLVAVTFSYAIAGFLIDLLYVFLSIAFAVLAFSGLIPTSEVSTLQSQFLNGGFPEVIGAVFSVLANPSLLLLGVVGGGITGLVAGAMGGFFGIIGGILGAGIGILILGCLIIYILFKLFLSLLTAYISIVVNIIIAPITLMFGALPGSKSGGIGKWIMNLLSDLLIFPAVAGLLIIARVILQQVQTTGLWSPPMLAAGGVFASALPTIMSIGLLLLLNKIPETIKKFFDEKYKKGPSVFAEQAGWIPGVGQAMFGFAQEKFPGSFGEARYQKVLKEQQLKDRAQKAINPGNPKNIP